MSDTRIWRLDNGYWGVSLTLPGFAPKLRTDFESKQDAESWVLDMVEMSKELDRC
jgi:hypothetical protein